MGPYRIDAELGAGGMGQVFRATDTRLDRAVAVKVLPPHRWSDPHLRHRFEREARALSSLSHPNLCALYDVGELNQSGGTVPYIVMELLEGETLRDRLDAGRLSLRKALTFGAQIASGLAAAHQKGVIHRDLKPENVFIVEGELLKILDFGLAIKTTTKEDASTIVRTEPGMVMGTAHYMSPEQVRGAALDARADIFSLGIVLFEMLSGRVPFHARSQVETMNSILVDEVPEMPGIPEAIEELVRRCMEKDPAQRFSSAKDLAYALESAAKSVTSATPTRPKAAPQQVRVERRAPQLLLLLTLASLIAAAAILSRRPDPDPEPPILRTLTYSGRDSAPASSPDAKLIAYVSSRDGARRIWLKQLADGTDAPVTSGPADSAPRFSPDGSAILFTRTANGTSALYRVAALGGDPRKLIDNAFDGDWSHDGRNLAFIRYRAGADRVATLCIAPVGGGAVRELASTTAEDFIAPRWSPDGRWLAVTRVPRNTAAGSVLLIDIESGERRVLARKQPHGLLSGVAWTRDGSAVIYVELEALEGAGMQRRGTSAIVLHDIDDDRARVLLRNPHAAADTVDVAGGGRLVFTEDVTRQSLQEIVLDGSAPPRWLSRGMSVDRQPAYARDGRSVVFSSDRGGNVDLWELMLDNGGLTRVTDHAAIDWDPHASGSSLFWSSNRGGHFEIWTAALDGASPQQVTRDGVDAENPSLPTSGDWIYYDSSNPKRDALWRIARNGGDPKLVVAGETIHPSVSADGVYVVYQRPETGGAAAIDVVRVSDSSVFTLVSGITGLTTVRPTWLGATYTVVYRALDANGRLTLFAHDFVPGTGNTRRALITADAETFAISPDGTRAILSVIDEASGIMFAEGIAGVE